jgi:hypothetical protein
MESSTVLSKSSASVAPAGMRPKPAQVSLLLVVGFCRHLEVGVARLLFILSIAFTCAPHWAYGENAKLGCGDFFSQAPDDLNADNAAFNACQFCEDHVFSVEGPQADPHDLTCCIKLGLQVQAGEDRALLGNPSWDDSTRPLINFDRDDCKPDPASE